MKAYLRVTPAEFYVLQRVSYDLEFRRATAEFQSETDHPTPLLDSVLIDTLRDLIGKDAMSALLCLLDQSDDWLVHLERVVGVAGIDDKDRVRLR